MNLYVFVCHVKGIRPLRMVKKIVSQIAISTPLASSK